MHNNPGLYSMEDIWNFIKALCAGIITIAGAVGVILKGISLVKAPSNKIIERIDGHDARLDDHENRLNKHDEYLGNDNTRIDEIVKSNRVTQKALLAIMDQLITGNSIEKLGEAKDEVESFLINK